MTDNPHDTDPPTLPPIPPPRVDEWGTLPDALDVVLDAIDNVLPPASEMVGQPGHDLARASARRAKAVRLRLAGATYDQVATACGYANKSNARKAVVAALSAVEVDSVSELRLMENYRIDRDERALVAVIEDSRTAPGVKVQAVRARTDLSARRSRLNGMDAPIQVALSAGVASDLADALAEAEAVLLRGEVLSVTDTPVPAIEA